MTLGIISINCPVAKSLPYAGVYRPAMAKAHYCEVDLDTGEYGKLSALHSFRFKVPLNSRPTDDDVRAVNMLFAILRETIRAITSPSSSSTTTRLATAPSTL
eukprot:jgi/Mesvir1/17342/Mv01322-RA.1